MRKKRPDGTMITPEKMSQQEADEHLSQMSASFVSVTSELPPQDSSSTMFKNTKRILYAEANVKGDCNSDIDDINDGEEEAASLGDHDSESNCDVDEHSDMMHEEGYEIQASPPSKNIGNFDTRHVKMILSSSSLRTVPEVNSCGALSSGQVSVDKKFMSPDLLALKQRRESGANTSQQLGSKQGAPCFKQPNKN